MTYSHISGLGVLVPGRITPMALFNLSYICYQRSLGFSLPGSEAHERGHHYAEGAMVDLPKRWWHFYTGQRKECMRNSGESVVTLGSPFTQVN